MMNPKTTGFGYMIVLLGAALFLIHLFQGSASWEDLKSLALVASGLGLVNAMDGSH